MRLLRHFLATNQVARFRATRDVATLATAVRPRLKPRCELRLATVTVPRLGIISRALAVGPGLGSRLGRLTLLALSLPLLALSLLALRRLRTLKTAAKKTKRLPVLPY